MRRPFLGERASRSLLIDERHVGLYVQLTGDHNPIHLSEEYARKTLFKRTIIHEGITTGLVSTLIAEELPGPGSVFFHADWSFQNPVHVGDTITAEAEVMSVHHQKPVVVLRTSVYNQDDTMVLDGQATIYLLGPEN